jgi:hypothetical protein
MKAAATPRPRKPAACHAHLTLVVDPVPQNGVRLPRLACPSRSFSPLEEPGWLNSSKAMRSRDRRAETRTRRSKATPADLCLWLPSADRLSRSVPDPCSPGPEYGPVPLHRRLVAGRLRRLVRYALGFVPRPPRPPTSDTDVHDGPVASKPTVPDEHARKRLRSGHRHAACSGPAEAGASRKGRRQMLAGRARPAQPSTEDARALARREPRRRAAAGALAGHRRSLRFVIASPQESGGLPGLGRLSPYPVDRPRSRLPARSGFFLRFSPPPCRRCGTPCRPRARC